jgi:hypothetical protein
MSLPHQFHRASQVSRIDAGQHHSITDVLSVQARLHSIFPKPDSGKATPAKPVVCLVTALLESVSKVDEMISSKPIPRQLLLGVKTVRRTTDRQLLHDGIGEVIRSTKKNKTKTKSGGKTRTARV